MTVRTARVVAGALPTALLVVVGIATSGCVPASPDSDTYADQAAAGLGTVLSEVATTQQLLELLAADKLPRAAAVAQLRYSEDSIDKATSSFTGLNTPRGSDRLASRVDRLLSNAGDLVGQARLAVHRSEESRYDAIAGSLHSLADAMKSAEASVG